MQCFQARLASFAVYLGSPSSRHFLCKTFYFDRPSYCIVMIQKFNIAGSQSIATDEFLVSWRSLIFGVAGKHALNTHANAFCALHRTPSLGIKQVKAYEAI